MSLALMILAFVCVSGVVGCFAYMRAYDRADLYSIAETAFEALGQFCFVATLLSWAALVVVAIVQWWMP